MERDERESVKKGQLYEEVMKTCNGIWISENDVENGLRDIPDREKVDKLKLQLKAKDDLVDF